VTDTVPAATAARTYARVRVQSIAPLLMAALHEP
jgi:hypothetical protein